MIRFLSYVFLILVFNCYAQNNKLVSIGSPINTLDYSEFAPTISADGKTLIFESDRSGQWRLYSSQLQQNGIWGTPVELTEINNLVKGGEFLGGPCLSYDGQKLFFCSNMKGTIGGVDLWVSEKQNDIWRAPKNLGRTINTAGYEGFPSLSPDGKTIYYMRSGTKKSTDGKACTVLYTAEKRGAFFINPKAMPLPVNTGCEGYPRIMADGKTLIFSSKRSGGKGGNDLYLSKWQAGKWTSPQPLTFLNSEKDDELITVPSSGDCMYLSSTNKNNKDDIYTISLPKEFQPEKVVVVEGVVTNQTTHQPMQAHVHVSDINTNKPLMEVSNDSVSGKYILYLEKGKTYDVSVSSKGYNFQSEKYETKNIPSNTKISKNIELEPLKLNASFRLNNIFFDFDSSAVKQESTLELNRVIELMKNNPSMEVEISAHTDNKGSDEYNLKLSQARAESVVFYLRQHGIAPNRLKAVGYGESVPSVENTTEENRALNRRVEFKIIKL
jgi:outer membrane protein OmpA-like peptidoglycan-associated protein